MAEPAGTFGRFHVGNPRLKVLASLTCEIKCVSQVFQSFKITDLLQKSQVAKVEKQGRNDPALKKPLFIRIYRPLIEVEYRDALQHPTFLPISPM